jgi:hypothetical protein
MFLGSNNLSVFHRYIAHFSTNVAMEVLMHFEIFGLGVQKCVSPIKSWENARPFYTSIRHNLDNFCYGKCHKHLTAWEG